MGYYTDLVEKEKIKRREKNLNEVREEIDSNWVKEKINNYIARWPRFSYEEVKKEILNNSLVASMFAKDPSKQNIGEVLFQECADIKKLPSSGKNCIRFSPSGAIESKAAGNSKSADFYINGIYYTQKYTGENSGGAQDNQYHDVVEFLRNGSINNKVGAIVDGWYWEENGRRQMLINEFADNANVIINSADNFISERIENDK